MHKIKILFCTDGIFPHAVGGMQRHSRLLIEALANTGECEIIVVHPHTTRVFEAFKSISEITVQGIDQKKNYLNESYKYSKRVFQIAEKYPEYIVYSQGLAIWYNVRKVAHRLIVNPHGLEPFQAISFKDNLIAIPFKVIFSYIFRNSAVIISLGGRLTDILKRVIGDDRKIEILPNAVNLPEKEHVRNFTASKKINALFVARFASNKGIHILLSAIRELNEEGLTNEITFNLGGKGPLFEYYSKNFALPNVNYLGFVSDETLVELYKTNDVFVFPTLFEGMPTVILEAMSYKVPVIVSDVGATAELVDASNGYLIEKNNVEALKLAIKRFMKLPDDKKKELGENSIIKVKNNFTWNIVAQKHIELFKELNVL